MYRYIREAIDLLTAMVPNLEQAVEVARRKEFRSINVLPLGVA